MHEVVYGYTWGVRQLNDGAGDYRITFSLDGTNCNQTLNTGFAMGETFIIVPEEEEEVVIAAEPAGEGGISYLDAANNLTYIDIHILTKSGGSSPRGGGGDFVHRLIERRERRLPRSSGVAAGTHVRQLAPPPRACLLPCPPHRPSARPP